jgi:hypothetical protein
MKKRNVNINNNNPKKEKPSYAKMFKEQMKKEAEANSNKSHISTNKNQSKVENKKAKEEKQEEKHNAGINFENLSDWDNIVYPENNEIKNIISNNNEKNNINNFDKKEIINKKNLNPVKKSLFSEHMNFLNNLTEDRNVNYEKNKNDNNYNNLNYLNIPINNILQSTENKEFESKFINYDLGRTSGTSQIKDSLIAFEINDNHGDNKIPKLLNIQKNINFFNEEKERTKDELEKLADQFLNQSKNLEIKKDLYKKDESQINTITTIIDNNFNEDSI